MLIVYALSDAGENYQVGTYSVKFDNTSLLNSTERKEPFRLPTPTKINPSSMTYSTSRRVRIES